MTVAQIRAALTRMGFSAAAAAVATGREGMNTLEEYFILTDEEVESLCRVIRKPGGDEGGEVVALRAENNLKLMCFYIRYMKYTSRPLVVTDLTLTNVRGLRPHKVWQEECEAPEQKEMEFSHKTNWPMTIEAMEEHLKSVLGEAGIPLAYVIRPTVDPSPAAEDPATNYTTKQEELIARAPHTEEVEGNAVKTAWYNSDNEAVWEIMATWTRNTECWTYVRPAQKNRDGRMAFLNLKEHYLGPNNVDTQSSAAERTLQTTTYHGEKRRWNFERFSKLHKDQHAILEGLVEHGYSGIDDRSKVRYLMEGIRTTELDPVTTNIMATPALRTDFNACVGLYKEFIAQRDNSKPTRESRLAALNTVPDGRGDKRDNTPYDQVEPDMSVKDRYYNKGEYAKLSVAEKKGLKEKRKRRGNGKGGDKPNKKVKWDERTIKAIASQVVEQMKEDEPEDTPAPAAGGAAGAAALRRTQTTGRNRNNEALNRQG